MNTILVIEDELHLRSAIVKYLELEGLSADSAATLQEARELLAQGMYQIVVLDLNLPDGDGLTLATEIPPKSELIIVSARGALDQRLEGLHAGAYAYLVKPLYLPELVAIIRNIQERIVETLPEKPESVLTELAVSWKGAFAGAAPRRISGETGTMIKMPSAASGASGSLWLQPVGHDICLCRIDYEPGAQLEPAKSDIAAIATTWSSPSLVFTAAHAGSVRLSEGTGEAGVSLEPGMMRCRQELALSYVVGSSGREPSTLLTLCISLSLLRSIMGPDNAEALMGELGLGAEAPPSALHTVSPMVAMLFHACLPESQEGDQQAALGVQSRVLAFLNALADGLKYRNRPARHETLAEKLERLHEELLNPGAQSVRLEELAGRFNCSSKTLNDAFKKVYGQSISSFQLSRRMIAAHEELLTTEQPIKVIASRYGYTYVNHFITAFRKYFGYTPGTLRE